MMDPHADFIADLPDDHGQDALDKMLADGARLRLRLALALVWAGFAFGMLWLFGALAGWL